MPATQEKPSAEYAALTKQIGLIAGWGRYPIVLAQALQTRGYRVSCVAIKEHADIALAQICHRYHACSLTRMAEHIRFFKRQAISTAVFAGKIHKVRFFERGYFWNHVPDLYTARCFFPHFISGRRDRKDDTLLSAAVDGYARGGVTIVPATEFVPELLVDDKFSATESLTKAQQQDVAFGWELAKQMGRLDIGQSVAVKGQAVLAVEAVEGTDECIKRAGTLCPTGGFTVIKVAKPNQDMRFDVPTIGVGTIETMHRAGAGILAIEAGRTIVVDVEEVLQLAKQYGIQIVAR